MREKRLTADQEERRRRLWHQALAECEPDMRDVIRDDPTGQDAIGLAIVVEIRAVAEENEKQDRY